VLYEFTKTAITKLPETTFGSQAITERTDLQRLLKQHIEVIATDTLIIAEEFSEWGDSKRRIDLLGLDRDANLVVIELKRTEDGGHMELQAVRYAAVVSTMTVSKAVEVYSLYDR
jgi:RecB family endonuclease NucS